MMGEDAQNAGGPDPAERSRRIVSESEELIGRLDLDAEARREFDHAHKEYAARLAQVAGGDTAALVEAGLRHLTRLGQIAMRNRGRGRGRGGG
jgi:hypothetical protein